MSTARAASLGFDTLHLEGALLLPDLLEKASQGKASGQTDADYHVPRGYTPKEEIGRAFRIVQAQWKVFGRSVVRADELSSKEFSLPVGFCFRRHPWRVAHRAGTYCAVFVP